MSHLFLPFVSLTASNAKNKMAAKYKCFTELSLIYGSVVEELLRPPDKSV